MGAATPRVLLARAHRCPWARSPAGRFASSWSQVCEVVSPLVLGGMQDSYLPEGLFICYLESGEGLPVEPSPTPLPDCLSQRTLIKGTNWTAIHQSIAARTGYSEFRGSCSQGVFLGTGVARGSHVGRWRGEQGHTAACGAHTRTTAPTWPATLAFTHPSSAPGWVRPALPFEMQENCIDLGLPARWGVYYRRPSHAPT